jgi:hypothetical protein
MEAEGGKWRQIANGWDFRDCGGVAAGLGRGGAAHWTVAPCLSCLQLVSSKLQLPHADKAAPRERNPASSINQMGIGCGIVCTGESYTTHFLSYLSSHSTAKKGSRNVFFQTRFHAYSGRESFI